MPIEIPQFVQYQAPLVPLRGLWHRRPVEGDRFVSCEIDWKVTTGIYNCVQISLGNSPVEFSQVVALNIDNTRNGGPVQFLFPDSASILQVPAFNQGLYPVFTNALTFYVLAPESSFGDVTIFQVLNSIPPPVAVQPSQIQSFAATRNLNITLPGIFTLIPPPTTGTLQSFSLVASDPLPAAGPQNALLQLQDGSLLPLGDDVGSIEPPPANTGTVLWEGQLFWSQGSNSSTPIDVTGLEQRFFNGLYLIVESSTVQAGTLSFTAYYSSP